MAGVRTRLGSILTSLPSVPHHTRTRSEGLVIGLTATSGHAFSGYQCQPRQADPLVAFSGRGVSITKLHCAKQRRPLLTASHGGQHRQQCLSNTNFSTMSFRSHLTVSCESPGRLGGSPLAASRDQLPLLLVLVLCRSLVLDRSRIITSPALSVRSLSLRSEAALWPRACSPVEVWGVGSGPRRHVGMFITYETPGRFD